MKIVLATKNRGKVREIKEILMDRAFDILTLEDFPDIVLPPEEGSTFEENALGKALFVASRTGMPALADDSGLEVDHLSGAPGVWSARYAGPGASDRDNFRKLLEELRGVPQEKRTARFVCVVAYAIPGGGEFTFRGTLEGRITEAPAGEHGFGYDPVFFIPQLGRTSAELTPDEKNRLSHRASALSRFKAWMTKKAAGGA